MNYAQINKEKYPLVVYLSEQETKKIINLFGANKMHYEYLPVGIRIKTKYIGKFNVDERESKSSQLYLCQSKKGYYLSLDHGHPHPGCYGKYDSGKNIFGKKVREEYCEGYKDIPGLEDYKKYYLATCTNNSDDSDISLWHFFFEESSL